MSMLGLGPILAIAFRTAMHKSPFANNVTIWPLFLHVIEPDTHTACELLQGSPAAASGHPELLLDVPNTGHTFEEIMFSF